MRRVIGYLDRRPIWSEHEPSEFPEELRIPAGSLVTGESGSTEKHRLAMAAQRARDKADPERYERRRATWHRSKVRHGFAAPGATDAA